MPVPETASGQKTVWTLLEKLGEGDAGEVYLATPRPGGPPSILKRPRPSAFTGEIFRQSSQIRSEGKVIAALSAADSFDPPLWEGLPHLRVGVPRLLDQGKPGSDFSGRNFIVLERAAGLDLATLARAAQVGQSRPAGESSGLSQPESILLDSIARSGRIPERLLLNILYRLALYLDFIHSLKTRDGAGILWNDVKPGHIYWDSQQAALTLIDWGNARFLEPDLATLDRKFSWADDFRQLFDELGRFLSALAPDLKKRLDWPARYAAENITRATIEVFKAKLAAELKTAEEAVDDARASEETLLSAGPEQEIPLEEIQAIQSQILEFGATPDFERTLRYTENFAARLASEDRLDDLRKLCNWAARLPGAGGPAGWELVDTLARIPGQAEGEPRRLLLEAIRKAVVREWDSALWLTAAAIRGYPEPEWWQDLAASVRRRLPAGPGGSGEPVRPLVAFKRAAFTLQAAARDLEDLAARGTEQPALAALRLLQEHFDEAAASWILPEPNPPDSGLVYTVPDRLLDEARRLIPDRLPAIGDFLAGPQEQSTRALKCWDSRDYPGAAAALRRLLVLDPDRRRVLEAERLMLSVPAWLERLRTGPQLQDEYLEWVSAVELSGREMRSRVGPAAWLDLLLETCKQLRLGAWPADLALARPELISEWMPWLANFERQQRLLARLNGQTPAAGPSLLQGVREDRVGPGEGLDLFEPLDSWMPEARGSSARVVSGALALPEGERLTAAVKLMRMEHSHYALPLFREEAAILTLLAGQPGVARLYELGFIRLDEESHFPLVSAGAEAPAQGEVVRIGTDALGEYLDQLEDRIAGGWTPYLAVERQPQEESIIYLCDAGRTRGQYQPTPLLVTLAVQICEVLEIAHAHNVVYRDHKILHYYWQPAGRELTLIDWNVARLHPDGLSQAEIEMDLVQFGARGLHHILTGRTAPGALPLGPTRPEEIEAAAITYQAAWTYDDQRLPAGLRAVLERVLAGEYTSAAALRDGLKKSLVQSRI